MERGASGVSRFLISPWIGYIALFSLVAMSAVAASRPPKRLPGIEIGMDRSNMATEWTISPPAEPKIYPFNGPYNGPGVFEARRTAVFDGVARLHPGWFRDGFGADTAKDAQLFADTVKQVHDRGIKLLAVVGPAGGDYEEKDYINPKDSGCQWGVHPLSKINLVKFEHRLRTHFDAVKAAGLSVDAFELGNELDLYCNDADMPKGSDFAAHHWKWFLTDQQVHQFAVGYVPFVTTFVRVIREYFPSAKIITCGMSNPTGNSAPLIRALANFTDASGKTFDYTSLFDGYGSHIYVPSDTTQHMIDSATTELTGQTATFPHAQQKPIWITEWSESGSAFWSSHKWYFQPSTRNGIAADLNKSDPQGKYPAMTRPEVIDAFNNVIEKLRASTNPVNVGYLFYYSYDSVGKSNMCDSTVFNTSRGIKGECYSGVIDPVTGDLLQDVSDAIMNRRQ